MAIAVKAGKVYGLRKMSNIDNIKNYTVIDLEMTGLSAKNDKIIEIGAARVRGGEIVDTVSTDRKSTRLNSSHNNQSRMPSSA